MRAKIRRTGLIAFAGALMPLLGCESTPAPVAMPHVSPGLVMGGGMLEAGHGWEASRLDEPLQVAQTPDLVPFRALDTRIRSRQRITNGRPHDYLNSRSDSIERRLVNP